MKQEKKKAGRSEEFPYIYETVVKKHRREQIRRLLCLIGGAALFGCVAGACCILFIRRFRPKETPVMAVDVNATAEAPVTGGESGTIPAETVGEQQAVSDGRQSIPEACRTAFRAFVKVSTVYGSSDWLDEEPSAVGTTETFGIIIAENSEEYYILTVADVIERAESIYLETEQVSVEASIQNVCRVENIGVISVWKEDLPQGFSCQAAVLGSSGSLQPGDTVFAAGSPYAFAGSVNYGHVTYMGREETYDCSRQMVYTDMTAAADSHGVLLSERGELVAWIVPSSKEGVSNLICAAAMEELHQTVERLVDGEPQSYLGIMGHEVTEQISKEQGIPEGFYITAIEENSPAQKAGLQPGDLVLSAAGQEIKNSGQLGMLLQSLESGDSITIVWKRMVRDQYEEMEMEAVLGER